MAAPQIPASLLLCVAAATLLSACAPDDPQLMTFAPSRTGPDEFLVAPAKPLEMPPDTAALPPPVRGAANRADPTPQADAIAALGGRPDALSAGDSVPAADAGLLSYSSRFGRDPTIRPQLAAADLEFRRGNRGRLLERVFSVNTYYRAYAPLSLNQQAEAVRFRRAGIPVSAAPPPAVPE